MFALALLTRWIWVLWVHPPGAHVFSDMARYLERAQGLAEHGPRFGVRTMAWQAWGTHTLMAGLMKLVGATAPFVGLALVWATMWAAVVPATYALARRILDAKLARVAGVCALLWIPHLSLAGYFTSEAPFTLVLIAGSVAALRTWELGRTRDGLLCGVAFAIAFALRPQVALFFALGGLALLLAAWRRKARVHWRAWTVAAALIAVSVVGSMWRFSAHTGRWGGVAENAEMNLTAARCHNIVTQAFLTEDGRARSEARGSTLDGRRVSLPGFRQLATTGDSHPLALRPALGGETIRFVGYIGDPQAHAELRRRCYAATGLVEQARYSLVNLSLLWVLNYPWPEASDRRAAMPLHVLSRTGAWLFVILFMVPSWLGTARALREGFAGARLCALQLLSLFALALVFFGTPRLRCPYDPFALILALPYLASLGAKLRAKLRARRS